MKMKRRILAALLAVCLMLVLSSAAFAEGETFNAYLDVTQNDDGSITVIIPDENAAVLAAEKPTLSIPCTITSAQVSQMDVIIPSTTSEGMISFVVERPGVYIIAAPSTGTFNITLVAGDGTGEMEPVTVTDGHYTLPECTFTPPAGKTFDGWLVGANPDPQNAGTEIVVSSDLILTATWAETGTVKTASLTLEGQIGINFRIKIPESIKNAEGAQAVFVYKDVDCNPIALSGLTPDSGTTDEYILTYFVPAKEIANKIGVKLVASDGSTFPLSRTTGRRYDNDLFQYAVVDYCAKVPATSAYADLKALVDSLQNYGTYAWIHFGSSDTQPTLASTVDMSGITLDTLLPYKSSSTGSISGLTTAAISLELESETTIFLRFVLSNGLTLGDLSISGGTVTETSDGFIVAISNIAAADLDTKKTVTITHGEETMIRDVYALSYAYSVLRYSTDETIINTVKALYLYNQAANAYFHY